MTEIELPGGFVNVVVRVGDAVQDIQDQYRWTAAHRSLLEG